MCRSIVAFWLRVEGLTEVLMEKAGRLILVVVLFTAFASIETVCIASFLINVLRGTLGLADDELVRSLKALGSVAFNSAVTVCGVLVPLAASL